MMEALKPEERYPFIAGLVEGLAYSRYQYGNKDEAGMNCVISWFYETQGTLDKIYAAFGEFPAYPPAAVVAALAKKTCGE